MMVQFPPPIALTASMKETAELLHARVVLPAAPPLGGANGEPG
jgi:hypothetical protein